MKMIVFLVSMFLSMTLFGQSYFGTVYSPARGELKSFYSPEYLISFFDSSLRIQVVFPDGRKWVEEMTIFKSSDSFRVLETTKSSLCQNTELQDTSFRLGYDSPLQFKLTQGRIYLVTEAKGLKSDLEEALLDPNNLEWKVQIKETLEQIDADGFLTQDLGVPASDMDVARINGIPEAC